MIALAGSAGLTRETAAGRLWSRSPDAQARTNLRQALSSLKSALGEGANIVRSSGQSLVLDRSKAEVDLDALTDTPADPTAVLTALGGAGPLMDGFWIDEPEFAVWLDEERSAIERRLTETLAGLGAAFLADGDGRAALTCAEKIRRIDAFDESGCRIAMRALVGLGAPAQAIRWHQEYEKVFRSELGIGLSAETQLLYDELVASKQQPLPTPKPERSRPVLAVLPFAMQDDDAGRRSFADGLVEDIITQLSRFSTFAVVNRQTAFALRDSGLLGDEIGAKLGADYLVNGSVRWLDQQLRVSVELAEAASGALIWAERLDLEAGDLFDMQDTLSRHIVAALPGHLQDDVADRAAQKPVDRQAVFELMLRGKKLRDSLSLAGNLEARELLKRAIDIDPGNARAHMYFSDSYVVEHWFGYSSAEGRALALDHAQKAIELDASDVYINDHLGFALHCNGLWDAAETQIRKAVALSENEVESVAWCGYALLMLGRTEDACRIIDEVSDRGVSLPPTFDWIVGQKLIFSDDDALAVETLNGAALLNAMAYGFLAGAYARLGRKDEAAHSLAAFKKVRIEELKIAGRSDRGATIETLAGGLRAIWRREEDWRVLADGLRLAGLPD